MKRSFKYRAYPQNDATEQAAWNWLHLCRRLYNTCLEQRIDAYQRYRRSLSDYTQQLELKTLKVEFPEYATVGSQVLKDVVRRLDKSYQAFFRKVKMGVEKPGFPKFKGRDFYRSFVFPNSSGWSMVEKDGQPRILDIKHVGQFRLRGGRGIQGQIKTVTVRYARSGKWFVVFSCDGVPATPLAPTGREIALDMGVNRLLTDSDGNQVANPEYMERALRRLRILERKKARQKLGSNRRKQTVKQIAKLYEHCVNQRDDTASKTARDYAQRFDRIVVEDLSVAQMVSTDAKCSKLTRRILDAKWTGFRSKLENKAEEFGREVVAVDPAYTTRTCNKCGYVHDRPVVSMTFACPWCGNVSDRPMNSAQNVKIGRPSPPKRTNGKASCARRNVSHQTERASQTPQTGG